MQSHASHHHDAQVLAAASRAARAPSLCLASLLADAVSAAVTRLEAHQVLPFQRTIGGDRDCDSVCVCVCVCACV